MDDIFPGEHAALLQSYNSLREPLIGLESRLRAIGDTDYFQHHFFADRAGSLVQYLDPALALAQAGWYEAAFAICRSSLEHHLIDVLLFLADRYRLRLKDFPKDEFLSLAAAQEKGDSGTEDILELDFNEEHSTMTIVRTGVHTRGGDRGAGARSLSIYYRVLDDFNPFRVSRYARPYVRSMVELPEDVVSRHLQSHSDAWRQSLRWEAIKDNLVMNELFEKREVAQLDVHYSFLSAYAHPVSPRAPAAIRGHNARGFQVGYDHYASELVVLYIMSLAVRELEAFRAMTDREPRVVLESWGEVKPIVDTARSRAAHLWFPKDDPPFFDREEEATFRNRKDDVPYPASLQDAMAIPVTDVRYHANPLERLRHMHMDQPGEVVP